VADPDQAFGGQLNRGPPNRSSLVQMPKVVCNNFWVSHKSGYLL